MTRHVGYNNLAVVATETLASTVSGSNLQLKLGAVDAGGGAIGLTAEFLQDGATISSLSYTDPAGYMSGYVGFAGGDAFNTGTSYGITVNDFSVGSVIPEPTSLALIGLGAVLVTMRRYRFV